MSTSLLDEFNEALDKMSQGHRADNTERQECQAAVASTNSDYFEVEPNELMCSSPHRTLDDDSEDTQTDTGIDDQDPCMRRVIVSGFEDNDGSGDEEDRAASETDTLLNDIDRGKLNF